MVTSRLQVRNASACVLRTVRTGIAPRRFGQGYVPDGGLARRTAQTIETYSDAEVTPLADSEEVLVRTLPFPEEACSFLRLPRRMAGYMGYHLGPSVGTNEGSNFVVLPFLNFPHYLRTQPRVV